MITGEHFFLYGRSHGMISRVLTSAQLKLLLSSQNLVELRAAFTQTEYDTIIGDLDLESDIEEVARRFKDEFARLLTYFFARSSGTQRNKIDLFVKRYHSENMRYILRGKYIGNSPETIMERLIPVSSYNFEYYEKLLDLPIIDIIKKESIVDLRAHLLGAHQEYESTNNFVPIDAAIDQYLYELLPKISSRYTSYVNLRNILQVCRCIVLEVPPYRYLLPNSFISKALNCTTVKEVLDIYDYGDYQKVFSPFLSLDPIPLHDLEFAVERFQINKWWKIFRYSTVFESDAAIAFLELKLAELMDLSRLIMGISANLSEKEIIDSFLFYRL